MTSVDAASAPAGFRRPVASAVVGGGLWIPYGAFELVQPWGADTRYDADRAYDVVVDRGLHHLYSLPGSLALLLCAVGLLVLLRRLGVHSRAARLASGGACALASISAAGVLLGFDPAFTGARILGTVLLGIALLTAGRAASRTRGATAWQLPLVSLGGVALFLLPVWPLVFALQWLTPGAGAAIIALHGWGWMIVGSAAPTERIDEALPGSVRPAGAGTRSEPLSSAQARPPHRLRPAGASTSAREPARRPDSRTRPERSYGRHGDPPSVGVESGGS